MLEPGHVLTYETVAAVARPSQQQGLKARLVATGESMKN